MPYIDAATRYGVQSVQTAATDWLLVNLMSFYSKHEDWLCQIDTDLMEKLVSHADLFVIQTEFSLYMVLRLWMFLQLHPVETRIDQETGDETRHKTPFNQRYFSEMKDDTSFLQKTEGRKYEPVFRRLRFHHLLHHPVDVKAILEDNIIPRGWLNEPALLQWSMMLYVDHNLETG